MRKTTDPLLVHRKQRGEEEFVAKGKIDADAKVKQNKAKKNKTKENKSVPG